MARARRDPGLAEITCDPLVAGLHSDPRYAAMLKKLNLPVGTSSKGR